MAKSECRHEAWNLYGPVDVLFVAYGTVARICKTAIEALKERGVKAGLFRPITLFPYPGEALSQAAEKATHVLVSELSCGQMVEDARYHVAGKRPVAFCRARRPVSTTSGRSRRTGSGSLAAWIGKFRPRLVLRRLSSIRERGDH